MLRLWNIYCSTVGLSSAESDRSSIVINGTLINKCDLHCQYYDVSISINGQPRFSIMAKSLVSECKWLIVNFLTAFFTHSFFTKEIQECFINHYEIKSLQSRGLSTGQREEILLSSCSVFPAASRCAVGARWWNYYIKRRNRRARSFPLGNFLVTQWKNYLFRRTI